MDIKDPRRAPSFKDLYPSTAALEAELQLTEDVASAVGGHVEKLDIPTAAATYSDFSPQGVSATQGMPSSFNIRNYSDFLMESMNSRIVPSCHGKIERILITVPTARDAAGNIGVSDRHARHYRSLISALSDSCSYLVLCHPNNQAGIQRWFDDEAPAASVAFSLSPRFRYSIWAQDAYVGLSDASGSQILAEGVSFPRYEDMTIADDIASQDTVSVLQSYMYFQGGNVLGGPEKTIVGYDYIWRNHTRAFLETTEKVLARYGGIFGTDIIPVGGRNSLDLELLEKGVQSGYGLQPIFHIDMYVTPTGVIGDSGKEIVFLGRPKEAHRITGRWSEEDEFNSDRYDRLFDETEQQLSDHFEVKYLPLFLTKGDLAGYYSSSEFYGLSFNNVVIECYDDGGNPVRNVILPIYSEDSGLFGTDAGIRRDLEDAAEEAWQQIGYTVKRMDGLEELAYGLGSVHCITKVLKRTPFQFVGA